LRSRGGGGRGGGDNKSRRLLRRGARGARCPAARSWRPERGGLTRSPPPPPARPLGGRGEGRGGAGRGGERGREEGSARAGWGEGCVQTHPPVRISRSLW
jgi:hypothetical protein